MSKSIKHASVFVIFSIFSVFSFSGLITNYDNPGQYVWGDEQTSYPYIKILYSINVGADEYLIHYDVCAGEQALQSPKILLESNYETIQFESTKLIYPYSCFSYESQIHTKSPNLVNITFS